MNDERGPMSPTTVTTPQAAPGEQRIFLENVSWATFESLLDDLGEHHPRLAYDQGLLEIMSPHYDHESITGLLGQFVQALTQELAIPLRSARSTMLKRADLRRGVQPDESFYVGDHALGRWPSKIDLTHRPPPDLVVEVDITRSSRARLPIYAALGVPEVWQWIGDRLRVLRLQHGGGFAELESSAIFPMLPISGLEPFLRRRHEMDDTQLVREFREWIRRVLGESRGGNAS